MGGEIRRSSASIVYNFVVDDLHCYTVGWNGILVHNSNGMEGSQDPQQSNAPSIPTEPVTPAPKGETQSIYKAPQAGKGQKQLAEGYHPDDFPATQGSDGKAYFAKDKSIADEYAPHGPYGEGVIEVQVPKDVYDARLRQYEQPYQGGPRTELPIPPKEFDVLNNSPRKLHP